MLNIEKTRIDYSKSVAVSTTATILDEGVALVVEGQNGILTVKPAAGVADEVFYGFALFQRRAPVTLPTVRNIPGTGAAQTITLANFVSGSALITVDGAALNTTTAEATITTAGVISIIATVTSSKIINVTYSRTPTIQELIPLVGTIINTSELDAGADVGAIKKGTVFLSNFITSDAWKVGSTPKLGAKGNLTLAGSGEDIDAFVTSVPSESDSFLGIELNV